MKIQGLWWKALGFILILYSLIGGLLVPLGPGIIKVHPDRTKAGETITLSIQGYNTRFLQGSNRAWLRLSDQQVIEARSVQAISDRSLEALFDMPEAFPDRDSIHLLNLIVINSERGLSVLPRALSVTGNNFETAATQWDSEKPKIRGPSGTHFPFRNILAETIRNNYYHVPLWFAMMVILAISMIASVQFIRKKDIGYDHRAYAFASVGTLLGLLGILTGAIWARHTWGAYWSFDVKQNMAAIAILIYLAYFILRNAIADPDTAKRLAAAYNIFAFLMLVPLLFIIPRMTESLHPGSGGNPAFSSEDLDDTMRMVFYPAVIGWILFSIWMAHVYRRILRLQHE